MADRTKAVRAQIDDEAANHSGRAMQNPAALLQGLAELEAEFAHLFAEWHANKPGRLEGSVARPSA